jgi:DNA polymerase-3 subunit alpha
LLSVELDRRAGDDTPRVTVKRFQSLDQLAKRSRLQMSLSIRDRSVIAALSAELASARGGNGVLRASLMLHDGRRATLLLGRDFHLDADLAARLERLLGPDSVDLSAQEPPRLALVG